VNRSRRFQDGTNSASFGIAARLTSICGPQPKDVSSSARRRKLREREAPDALISQKTRTLVKKFGRLFPDLQLEVAYAWAGTFGETRDGLAYIGVHPRFRTPICVGLRWEWHHLQPHCRRDHPDYFLAGQIAMPTCSVSVADGAFLAF